MHNMSIRHMCLFLKELFFTDEAWKYDIEPGGFPCFTTDYSFACQERCTRF